ncbi:MAG TPA: sigma-70 family RNA polymerase sigma factor, partial [Actinomycetota bacterium]|nr:sigma-70 family RNA polymerase sigma factor [Actinomycetota bacterium]
SMAGWFASQYDDLRRFGFVLSGDWSIADDLVQEAFVRICSRPRRVEREGFPAYARRTMVNLWRTALVRIRLERRHATDGDRLTAPDSGSVAGNDQVWQAVMALSPQQRAVVALRYYEDMSEADIAAVLGVSLGAVKKQLNRAKEKMRATLGEGERHGS